MNLSKTWLAARTVGRPFLGLFLVLIIGALVTPNDYTGHSIFLSPGNLTDILLQQGEIGIIALAMTFVIIGAGIDLSVGSILACSASLAAIILVHWSSNTPTAARIALAAGAALTAGAAIGLINGFVIAYARLPAFVMTLATMIGVRGFTKWMTQNTNIDFGFADNPSAVFADIFSRKIFVIGIWLTLAALLHLVLTRTVFGRYLRAIGENERAALYTGLPIASVKMLTYIGCGLLAALAGLIHSARSHQGNPNDGIAYELDAIAAVVIGGTALAGGSGSIIGTLIGTLILGLITNILRLRMIDSNLELMIKAFIIVIAVWIQRRSKANLIS